MHSGSVWLAEGGAGRNLNHDDDDDDDNDDINNVYEIDGYKVNDAN